MSGDGNSDFGGEMKRASNWHLPLELLGVIIVLGGIAYWILTGQSIDLSGTKPDPTDSKTPVEMSVDGLALTIPANYMPLGRNRAGGEQEDVRLRTLLPDMRGWSRQDAALFASNAPDAKVVQIGIGLTKDRNTEKQRFEKVLKPYVVNEDGEQGPYGLTKYAFAEGQGYDGVELYTFTGGEDSLIVLQCETAGDAATGPSCWRTIKPEGRPTITITYRFKRSQLAEWPAIDQGVVRLVKQFKGEIKTPES
jgi:hypothetical protein